MRRAILLLLFLPLIAAGCTTTTTGAQPPPTPKPPKSEPGNALIFGRVRFTLDNFLGRTGDIQSGIRLCLTEYWPSPSEEIKEHWLTTDGTGYYELSGANPLHGYNVSKIVLPAGDQTTEVKMGFRMRPDYRILSLGELVCTVPADGRARYAWNDASVYNPNRPLIQYVLKKHAGDQWGRLVRERYIKARATGGF
ncbi:MAG: hypothetical protein V2A58_02385 [Planctomycetota bacterium]